MLQDKCLTIFNPFLMQDPCLSASAAAAAAAAGVWGALLDMPVVALAASAGVCTELSLVSAAPVADMHLCGLLRGGNAAAAATRVARAAAGRRGGTV